MTAPNVTPLRKPPVCHATHWRPECMTDAELCNAINGYWAEFGIESNARVEPVLRKSISQAWISRTAIVSDLRGTEKPGRAGELGT